MSSRGMRRYVADLLSGRSPRPFRPDPEEVAQLRAAIDLAAAGPGAGAPRPDFVADLHRRLAADAAPATVVPIDIARPSRRRVVLVGSVAAGAAAIGAATDHLLTPRHNTVEEAGAAAPATLEPNTGVWHGIGEAAALQQGGVTRFDLGTVVGFVSRDATGLRAVSGVCTHLGCRLNLDAAARRLDCPCHSTSFAVDGTLVHYQLAKAPAPLPHLMVRERDGVIEVYVPV